MTDHAAPRLVPSSGRSRRGRRARWLARVAALTLLVWALVAWLAAEFLIDGAELERADALVVLSGSAAYRERNRRAAALFREGRAPLVILTNDNQQGGWSEAEQRNPTFVERARDELLRAGVPAENIVVLPQLVSSTHDEAVLLRDYARARNLRSLSVVTSAYHSRRALWTLRRVFRGEGINVGVFAVAPGGPETPPPSTWWLHAKGWPIVAGEYLKFVYYLLHY